MYTTQKESHFPS